MGRWYLHLVSWLVVMGCVRFGRAQRSEWLRSLGRRKRRDQHAVMSQAQAIIATLIWAWFLHQWTVHERWPPEAIEYDFESSHRRSSWRLVGWPFMELSCTTELGDLMGKSCRQIPITWGTLCELSSAQMVALGNWTDQQQEKNVSAVEVHRLEATSGLLKHTLGCFLIAICETDMPMLKRPRLDDAAFQQTLDVIASKCGRPGMKLRVSTSSRSTSRSRFVGRE